MNKLISTQPGRTIQGRLNKPFYLCQTERPPALFLNLWIVI